MTEPGLYMHRKGDLYVVAGLIKESSNAFEAERETRLKVEYWPLLRGPGAKNVRYEDEFHERVEWPDKVVRPRFCQLAQFGNAFYLIPKSETLLSIVVFKDPP